VTLEARDRAWAKVRRSGSTRWDLVHFEKADNAYRAECSRLKIPYIEPKFADKAGEEDV